MKFQPNDILPEYDVEAVEKLFFVRQDLSDLDEPSKQQLLTKLNSLGLKQTRYDNVQILLCTMHEARQLDESRFINDLFLPWFALRTKTGPHLERIARELSRVSEFEPGSVEEATHLVNIYRNQVADLFDPYMTLLVACFQFIEGKFTTLCDADLTNGERTKSEYLTKRINSLFTGETFLSGYDPLVRNAISHAGSRGITYLSDRVVFKNIKRETPPRIETVDWTFDELQKRILQLMESVVSIEAGVEIFGLDCSSLISADFSTQLNFAFHALSPQQVEEWKSRGEETLAKIRDADNADDQAKQEALSHMLFYNLRVRDMECIGTRFSSEKLAVCVDVPIIALDVDDDSQLLARLSDLIRYAILARSIFGEMYSEVLVTETSADRKQHRILGQFKGTELSDWIEEHAGIVDLLNNSAWSLDGKPLGVEVDFEKLSESELTSPDMPFPRYDAK
ncbi:hypothetical protein [Aeoliella sp.]|uniref:hypothetical protein n=1 Tax=Aeoliella sp. TaxID=2795800 RepID=UPI003CCC3817